MPVTIIPAAHQPKRYPTPQTADSLEQFLRFSCPDSYIPDETRVVASSFDRFGAKSNGLYPSSSSFVRSAIEAWGRHSHLVLRPDDVWFTILVQMNFYMDKNAASLRELFVSHGGKIQLTVWANDWEGVMDGLGDVLQRRVKAPWLTDWVSPGFSTSTEDDERTATVLMMGLMRTFFDYGGGIICGIPSITLLGTKQDWQRLLNKIHRLKDFGDEPWDYAHRLSPILYRIVCTFDSPTTAETKDFWNQMVQARVKHQSGCGVPPKQYTVSGWILGFFFWDGTGHVNRTLSKGRGKPGWPGLLQYDGVHYGEAPLDELPIGYAKVQFTMLNDHGGTAPGPFKGWVLAGSIGKSIVDGAPEGYKAAFPGRYDAEPPEMANDEGRSSGCFSGLLRSLSCFGGKQNSLASQVSSNTSDEKQASEAISEKSRPSEAHSTIQPMSAWFLFGPEKDPGPFYDDVELDGPTVDAIDSCEGVESHQE